MTGTESMVSLFFTLALMVVLLYFMIYRPQKKQEKKDAAMRNSLEIGDQVTTIGGVIGRVVAIKDDTFVLETGSDRVKIRFTKTAIARWKAEHGQCARSFLQGFQQQKVNPSGIHSAPPRIEIVQEARFMSANTIWRSAPVSVLAAFALGAAAAAGCGAALAALMASRGMSPGTAWPFATARRSAWAACWGAGCWPCCKKAGGCSGAAGWALPMRWPCWGSSWRGAASRTERSWHGWLWWSCPALRAAPPGPPHRKAPPPLTGRRPNGTGAARCTGPQAASEKLHQSLFGCDPIRRTSYVGLSGARLIQNPCRAAGCARSGRRSPAGPRAFCPFCQRKSRGFFCF